MYGTCLLLSINPRSREDRRINGSKRRTSICRSQEVQAEQVDLVEGMEESDLLATEEEASLSTEQDLPQTSKE